MSLRLRPAFFVPAALLLVFVTVAVTLVFASLAVAPTQPASLSWMTGISAAGVSAVVAICGFVLNRQVAIRSVTIEALWLTA
jgi:hypothetical protein